MEDPDKRSRTFAITDKDEFGVEVYNFKKAFEMNMGRLNGVGRSPIKCAEPITIFAKSEYFDASSQLLYPMIPAIPYAATN